MTELALRLKQLLTEKQLSIAIAESLTGGNIQAAISSVSGSSKYFAGGITAYNIDQKVNLLGVDRDHAATVNCVSRQVAESMAIGVRKTFQTDLSLATTGYAEPWPAENIKQPFAFFAINVEGYVQSGRIDADDRTRTMVQEFVTTKVLSELIHTLKGTR